MSTRREFLTTLAGLGAALSLTSCQNPQVVQNLPDYQPEALPVPQPGPPSTYPTLPPPGIKPIPAFGSESFGIYPRSAWTTTGPNMNRISPMDGVKYITFHHSGDQTRGRDVPFLENGYQETIAHLELVRRYHMDNKRWGDIGYHFAIDRMGRVWQLRSLKYQGAHVLRHDEHNMGIVVLGNFNVQTPTDAQLDRIKSFGRLARTQYQLDINRIYTHRELMPTDCPGKNLQPYMVAIRKQKLL